MQPSGPGAPYTLLFDEDPFPGLRLPTAFRSIYGGDWRLPAAPPDRPYTFTNFVTSHDGKISFDLPGRNGGGDISRNVGHDHWLMGLLRARADAILTGGATLRVARTHRWTPEGIFPADAAAYAALRAAEGRSPVPLLVIVSASGELPPADAPVLNVPGQALLIATTAAGAARARATLGDRPAVSYHVGPDNGIAWPPLLADLRARGIATLLSEGGARIYGELIRAGMIDEVFLTRSPIIVGNSRTTARTSLVEGVAFHPDQPPQLELLSLRRHASYLFERARFAASVPAKPML
jgi:5-amino-6-(5-phosphoribosylamino)uracil reductase